MNKLAFYLYKMHRFFAVYIIFTAVLLSLHYYIWNLDESLYLSRGEDYGSMVRVIVVLTGMHMLYKFGGVVSYRSGLIDNICEKEGIDRNAFFSESFIEIKKVLTKEV